MEEGAQASKNIYGKRVQKNNTTRKDCFLLLRKAGRLSISTQKSKAAHSLRRPCYKGKKVY